MEIIGQCHQRGKIEVMCWHEMFFLVQTTVNALIFFVLRSLATDQLHVFMTVVLK